VRRNQSAHTCRSGALSFPSSADDLPKHDHGRQQNGQRPDGEIPNALCLDAGLCDPHGLPLAVDAGQIASSRPSRIATTPIATMNAARTYAAITDSYLPWRRSSRSCSRLDRSGPPHPATLTPPKYAAGERPPRAAYLAAGQRRPLRAIGADPSGGPSKHQAQCSRACWGVHQIICRARQEPQQRQGDDCCGQYQPKNHRQVDLTCLRDREERNLDGYQ